MINNIADLLNSFKIQEQELLKKYGIIKHGPTIGDMYEGLTKDILEKGIFEGLNLKVVGGKIINNEGVYSNEIDCMLVFGEGELIPYTDKYIYNIANVIAVIEVKKNLFSEQIKGSFQHLNNILDININRDSETFMNRISYGAFKLICRKDVDTQEELEQLGPNMNMIFSLLRLEAFHPLRIVWGYNGFKSELKFREAFFNYLDANKTTDIKNKKLNFGPTNFPSMIICGEFSFIKNTGMPFGSPLLDNGYWPFYTSSSYNPIYYFLELIWTRLSFQFNLSAKIFGEDLEKIELNRFLDCRYKFNDGQYMLEYNYSKLSKKSLNKPIETKPWEPIFLDINQYVLIHEICQKGEVEIGIELKEHIESQNLEFDKFISELIKTGLVCKTISKNALRLLTKECKMGITSDGKFFAGENNSGRVDKWMLKLNKNKLK